MTEQGEAPEFPQKQDGHLRIVTINCRTALSEASWVDRGSVIVHKLRDARCDVWAAQDTGTTTMKQNEMKHFINSIDESKTMSAQLQPHQGRLKRVGGLLQVARGDLASRAAGVIADTRGWTRYDVSKFRGRNKKTLYVVNLYMPLVSFGRQGIIETQDGDSMQAILTRRASDERGHWAECRVSPASPRAPPTLPRPPPHKVEEILLHNCPYSNASGCFFFKLQHSPAV